MKSLGLKLLMSGFSFLYMLTTHAISPAYGDEIGKTQNTFTLRDEVPGNLISVLVKTEYVRLNQYQALLRIQADANLSSAGVTTPAFLSAQDSCPAGNRVSNVKASNFPSGSSLAISMDVTEQTVDDHSNDNYEKSEISAILSSIPGVGDGYFVHSVSQPTTAEINTPLLNWAEGGITYNVFAIALGSVSAPHVILRQKTTLSF